MTEDKKIISDFNKYLLLISLIIAIFALSFIYLFIRYYINYAIDIFNFFNNPINYFITISNSTIIFGILAYFYFFEHIKKNGVNIFVSEENESKYFSSFLSFYIYFTYAILFPFILYLIIKKAIFECFILVIFYLITNYIFVPFIENFKKLSTSYSLLHDLNHFYGILFSLNIFNKLKNDIHSIISDFNTSQKYIQPLKEDIIGMILQRSQLLLRYVFVFTLFMGFFSIMWKFNLLSIIYIELTLMVWYFILSAFLFMPKKEVNILLNNNERLEKVYVLENSPKGGIFILTPQNKIETIFKDSIIKIESN